MVVEEWGRDRAVDVAALVAAAMPAEELSVDELLGVCWDDPGPDDAGAAVGVVLVATDGDQPLGVAVAIARSLGDGADPVRLAWLKLIAVHPDHRRTGIGHELLGAIENWAWEQGATELHLAGSPPFYLWPGVDATATEMLCLVESRGYRDIGSDVNMALTTAFRVDAPDGVVIRRVVEDVDVARIDALVGEHWPEWLDETHRAIEHGCCHGAFTPGADGGGDDQAVGFACHSVNRAAWLGPMGTDPSLQQGGVGSALLAQVCRDLQIAEFDETEISWVGPARFYAKNGARISRVFRRYRLRRPDPA
jgi:GNAT superfamily N-acetyltransferase